MSDKIINFQQLMNDESIISPDLKAEVELEVELIMKMIDIRKEKGLTQRDLSEISGIKQSAIARTEKMDATPQISTMLKLLLPLGYKLEIVPIEEYSSYETKNSQEKDKEILTL